MRRLGALALLLPTSAWARAQVHVVPELSVGSMASSPATLMVLLAALSLLPFVVLTLTSFSKISVVLSLARSAMGTQQAPPTIVLTGIAAVLSATVMAPVVEAMVERGNRLSGQVRSGHELLLAASEVAQPLRHFLLRHGSTEARAQFLALGRELRPDRAPDSLREEDLCVVVPAFVLTELKEAFQMGFLLFLPFLVVDMVVANVLLALGMQSLSPSQVSLPFKILLFVAADGWTLLARTLVLGYRG